MDPQVSDVLRLLRAGVSEATVAADLVDRLHTIAVIEPALPSMLGGAGATIVFTERVTLEDGPDYFPGEAVYLRRDRKGLWRLWSEGAAWE